MLNFKSKMKVKDLSIQFSIQIINSYKKLLSKNEYVLSKQLLRSSTSIGANIFEAQNAESRADFIHKMSISLKESSETLYWLDLLKFGEFIEKNEVDDLIIKAKSLRNMLTAIIKTSKKKVRS